jgi:stage II sporulation protein D
LAFEASPSPSKLASPASRAIPFSVPTIRVRLNKGTKAGEFSGVGLSVGPAPRAVQTVMPPKLRQATIRLVKVSGRWPVWRVKFSDEKKSFKMIGRRLFVEADVLRMGARSAPHIIELLAAADGTIETIATLDLEKYLAGVLPAEMPARWPIETLKAQAVASRSYALALARERKLMDFDVEATIFDQVFNMSKKVQATGHIQEKVAEVVRATAGEILLDRRGRIVKAHYHADCGGRTELAHNVWGDRVPETGTTRDALCPLSPFAHWRYKISRYDLRKTLVEQLLLNPGLALESMAVVGRTASGRVANVDLVFSDKIPRRLSAHDFRRLLGFTNLKSTNFQVHWGNQEVLIEGKGNGHGVGLCQYGAKHLGERGLDYRKILANYYPESSLGRLRGERFRERVPPRRTAQL